MSDNLPPGNYWIIADGEKAIARWDGVRFSVLGAGWNYEPESVQIICAIPTPS